MLSTALLTATVLSFGVRAPPNAVNVTFYNLRPHNMSTDIIEKDSADALGDIFFYITDRLLVPYTCRNAPVGKVPFMCKGFQKRLQTNDQVYTKLIVEVDGTFGNCKSGADSCSAYADCNPTQSTGPLMWNCDCGRNHADGGSTLGFLGASPPFSDTGLAAVHVINNNNGNQRSTDPYWSCSDALDALCPIYGSVNSCTACAAIPTHQAKLQQAGCTPNDILKSCSADYNKCLAAVTGSAGCLLPPASSSASCNACARTPVTEAANCSALVLKYACRTPTPCNVTGKLEVSTRYCGSTDNTTGLCNGCADDCGGIWDHWKSEISQLGGIWYSTTREGNCADPAAPSCAWRVAKELKTVNATCANENVHKLVQKKGEACFNKCPQPTNSSTDCWILCFFETVLARNPLQLEHKTGGVPMTSSEIERAWLQAFESNDPSKGGCVPVPVDAAVATRSPKDNTPALLPCNRSAPEQIWAGAIILACQWGEAKAFQSDASMLCLGQVGYAKNASLIMTQCEPRHFTCDNLAWQHYQGSFFTSKQLVGGVTGQCAGAVDPGGLPTMTDCVTPMPASQNWSFTAVNPQDPQDPRGQLKSGGLCLSALPVQEVVQPQI